MQVIEASKWNKTSGIVVSIVVLLVLLVGGGFAYTYFFGPDNTAKVDATPPPAPAPTITPAKDRVVDPKTPVGVALQTVSSPIAPGENAMLNIRSKPGATCTVTVTYGGAVAKDSGLAPRKADEYGTVSWTWTVDPATPLGTAPIKISCARDGKSGEFQADQIVAKPQS